MLLLWDLDVQTRLCLSDCGALFYSDTSLFSLGAMTRRCCFAALPSERLFSHSGDRALAQRVHALLEEEWCINVGVLSSSGPRPAHQIERARSLHEEDPKLSGEWQSSDATDLKTEPELEALKQEPSDALNDEPSAGMAQKSEAELKAEHLDAEQADADRGITEEMLLSRLREKLLEAELTTTTEKQIRKDMEADFGVSLKSNKAAIHSEVNRFLAERRYTQGKASSTTNASTRHIQDLASTRVAVLGAGPAGIAAAGHLQKLGCSCTVYEARSRVGGRVHTQIGSLSVPVDLGASIITGTSAVPPKSTANGTGARPDPSSIFARQQNIDMMPLDPQRLPLYDSVRGDGSFVNEADDEAAEQARDVILDDANQRASSANTKQSASLGEEIVQIINDRNQKAGEDGWLSPDQKRLLEWHWANLEYGCAAELSEISLRDWNQDEKYGGFGGPHCMVKGGYSQIIEMLSCNLDIRYNSPVKSLSLEESMDGSCADSKIRVDFGGVSEGQCTHADAAVMAIPLGCLQAEDIDFHPPLPQWKTEAIARMGMGKLEKVMLEFDHCFWDHNADFFGVAPSNYESSRGRCFMFWNQLRFTGKPILTGLMAGAAAKECSKMTDADASATALAALRNSFGVEAVPEPVNFTVSRWSSDPWSKGSYSFVSTNASANDYDLLASSVWSGKLAFAGEHTCKEHPDTVGGALLTGARAANSLCMHLTSKDKDAPVDAYSRERDVQETSEEREKRRERSKQEKRLADFDVNSKEERESEAKAVWAELGFNKEERSGDNWQQASKLSTQESTKIALLHEIEDKRNSNEGILSWANNKGGLETITQWLVDGNVKSSTALIEAALRAAIRLLNAGADAVVASNKGLKGLIQRVDGAQEGKVDDYVQMLKQLLQGGDETTEDKVRETTTSSPERKRKIDMPEHLRREEEQDEENVERARRAHEEAIRKWREQQQQQHNTESSLGKHAQETEPDLGPILTFEETLKKKKKKKRHGHSHQHYHAEKESKKRRREGGQDDSGHLTREEAESERKNGKADHKKEKADRTEVETLAGKRLKEHYQANKIDAEQFRKIRSKVAAKVESHEGNVHGLSDKQRERISKLVKEYVERYSGNRDADKGAS